jgi:Domain of unknown function (DUF4878)
MKKIISITIIVVYLFSCKNNDSAVPPNKVFSTFADALTKKDLATAKKYCTPESQQVLDFLEKRMKNAPKGSAGMDKFDTSRASFGEAIINGDDAKLPIKDKESGMTIDFPLKKMDGEWKVAFDMKSLYDMTMETISDNKLDLKIPNLDSAMKAFKNLNLDSLEKEMGKSEDTVRIKH